jgi:hypothetical protein
MVSMLCSSELSSKFEMADISSSVLGFKELNGFVWSLDSQYRLVEWTMKQDQTGLLHENFRSLVINRIVKLNASISNFPNSQPQFISSSPSPIDAQIVYLWCIFSNCFVINEVKSMNEEVTSIQTHSNRNVSLQTMMYTAVSEVIWKGDIEMWIAEKSGEIFIWSSNEVKSIGNISLHNHLPNQYVTCMKVIGNEVRIENIYYVY